MKSLILVAAYSSVTLASGRVVPTIISSGPVMCQIWTNPSNAPAGLICLNEVFSRASNGEVGCEPRQLVLPYLRGGISLLTSKGK